MSEIVRLNYTAAQVQDLLNDISGKVTHSELDAKILALKNLIEGQIQTETSAVDAAVSSVTSIQSIVSAAQSAFAAVADGFASRATVVATLQSQGAAMQTAKASMTSRIAALELQLTGLLEEIAWLEGGIVWSQVTVPASSWALVNPDGFYPYKASISIDEAVAVSDLKPWFLLRVPMEHSEAKERLGLLHYGEMEEGKLILWAQNEPDLLTDGFEAEYLTLWAKESDGIVRVGQVEPFLFEYRNWFSLTREYSEMTQVVKTVGATETHLTIPVKNPDPDNNLPILVMNLAHFVEVPPVPELPLRILPETVESITIPSGVTVLHSASLLGANLSTVRFPRGLRYVGGMQSFEGYPEPTTFEFESGLTLMHPEAFFSWSGLEMPVEPLMQVYRKNGPGRYTVANNAGQAQVTFQEPIAHDLAVHDFFTSNGMSGYSYWIEILLLDPPNGLKISVFYSDGPFEVETDWGGNLWLKPTTGQMGGFDRGVKQTYGMTQRLLSLSLEMVILRSSHVVNFNQTAHPGFGAFFRPEWNQPTPDWYFDQLTQDNTNFKLDYPYPFASRTAPEFFAGFTLYNCTDPFMSIVVANNLIADYEQVDPYLHSRPYHLIFHRGTAQEYDLELSILSGIMPFYLVHEDGKDYIVSMPNALSIPGATNDRAPMLIESHPVNDPGWPIDVYRYIELRFEWKPEFFILHSNWPVRNATDNTNVFAWTAPPREKPIYGPAPVVEGGGGGAV